jgi:hypothetical protein
MLVVAVVILAGVVAVASGRGGEMAVPEPDYPPIDLGPVSAADVALLRPPSAAWGYNMRVTDEALDVIARAVTERDVQIAALQQQVSDLRERLGGGAWPAEAGSLPPESAAATADLEDTVPPAYPEPSEYLEYPEPSEYQSELDDPLAPAGPAGPEATAEPGVTEPGLTEPGLTEPGVTEDAQPAQEPVPEPAWPGEDGPQPPGPGPAVPPVAITRPQPIYRRPADHDDDPNGPGAADTAWDQPAVRSGPSAPWGPAQPPGQWHQPEQASAPEVHGPPESPADPEVLPGPETPVAPDDHGWGTDPADTSPDAKPLDWTTAPPSAGAKPAQPSAPSSAQPSAPSSAQPSAQPAGQQPAEPEPTDWDGRSQPSPAPSVWDVASRQVDEDQARPAPSAPGHHAEFLWDEDPHQTVVWGVEHARAKAARTADETLPSPEQRDGERG